MPFIIIVGAGPGISRSVALRFGREGYGIGLIARRPDKLALLTEELRGMGLEVDQQAADATQPEELHQAFQALIQSHGFPEMVLFNASTIHVKDLLELSWDVIQQGFEICTGGAFHTAKMVLPHMLINQRGKLFFTGGGTALQGEPQWTSLSIGKAGMRNLVQALVKRCIDTGVHVAQITVCGRVDPKDPKYNPEVIAEMYWNLFQQNPDSFQHEIIH